MCVQGNSKGNCRLDDCNSTSKWRRLIRMFFNIFLTYSYQNGDFDMTHMYERGQIVVPKYFREMLGWGTDTQLRLSIENNRLVIEKKESIADELERMANELKIDLKGKSDFDDEYDEGIRKKYRKMGLKF